MNMYIYEYIYIYSVDVERKANIVQTTRFCRKIFVTKLNFQRIFVI